MGKCGIVSYGIAVPYRRLAVDEIVDCWMNTSIELIKQKQGMLERGVLGFDEDGNTFSIEAAKKAIRLAGEPQIDALVYGTCTNPYDSRPSSTILLEALNLDYAAKAWDVQFSTKSGTAAMMSGYAMVCSGLARNAVAIGADTINRHTAPGDLLEPYASSGAGALVIGTEHVAATLDGFASYSTDLSDGFRVEGERYIRSGMLLGSAKNEVGVNDHTTHAVEKLMQDMGASVGDFNYVVVQQSTPGAARSCGRVLGCRAEQIEPAIFSETLGDTGSASTLIGLAAVLDIAQPGEKILVVSYGFGSGADAIALTVTDEIKSLQERAVPVKKSIAHKVIVDYKTAMKMEYKYIRPSHMLNAYL